MPIRITCQRCGFTSRITPSVQRHAERGHTVKCLCGLPIVVPPYSEPLPQLEVVPQPVDTSHAAKKEILRSRK